MSAKNGKLLHHELSVNRKRGQGAFQRKGEEKKCRPRKRQRNMDKDREKRIKVKENRGITERQV